MGDACGVSEVGQGGTSGEEHDEVEAELPKVELEVLVFVVLEADEEGSGKWRVCALR